MAKFHQDRCGNTGKELKDARTDTELRMNPQHDHSGEVSRTVNLLFQSHLIF